MSNLRSVVRGVGGYLPDRIVTNEDLTATVDTSDEWIVARTGIRERRIVADGELTSHMAIEASKRALEDGRLEAGDIDLPEITNLGNLSAETVREAHRLLESGKTKGKLAFTVTPSSL